MPFTSGVEPQEHLIDLAQRRFTSDAQADSQTFRDFFENAEAGNKTDLLKNDLSHEDPASSELWSKDRNIPAEWIEWLCRDPRAAAKVGAGLELDYARIVGNLNLTWAKIPFSLLFFKFAFTGQIILNQASIQGLTLQSTYIEGLDAASLSIKQELLLSDGFHAKLSGQSGCATRRSMA